MFRTQVYLTDDEKSGLESTALSLGVSQSNLIRLAIDELLARGTGLIDKSSIIDEVAGLWADRNDIDHLRDLRSEWGRRVTL
jgi:hypothetical protein